MDIYLHEQFIEGKKKLETVQRRTAKVQQGAHDEAIIIQRFYISHSVGFLPLTV